VKSPKFSAATIKFIKTASRQKRLDWLDKHRDEYEELVLEPLQNLARHLKKELGPIATGYNFPQKGIGRLKRPAGSEPNEYSAGVYRCWIHYSAAVPRTSRFETNPNLFFLIDSTEEPKDTVLVAGGLYMPSSKQMRALREAIAQDASAFDKLFADKAFKKCFPDGFSDERISTRVPRGFDPAHPRLDWIKLQAFFVWRPYKKSEFNSPKFPEIVARDFRQILRLNELLDLAIGGKLKGHRPRGTVKTQSKEFLERLTELGETNSTVVPARKMDF
jgi:uncharacterized protein (TIGR02453 family)